MMAWAIWQNSNEHRNRGKKKNSSAVVHKAIDYLHEYQAYCAKVEVHIPSLDANWTPPPPWHYKINVDGAVFGAQKAVGIGILVCDAEGRVVGACSKKNQSSSRSCGGGSQSFGGAYSVCKRLTYS